MNDIEKLVRCVYTLGFITAGLSRASDLNDWKIVREVQEYALTASQHIFYDDSCLKYMTKSGDERIVDDKNKRLNDIVFFITDDSCEPLDLHALSIDSMTKKKWKDKYHECDWCFESHREALFAVENQFFRSSK